MFIQCEIEKKFCSNSELNHSPTDYSFELMTIWVSCVNVVCMRKYKDANVYLELKAFFIFASQFPKCKGTHSKVIAVHRS